MTEPTASRPHMPGYGIADSDSGLLPWSWAQERLTNASRYWVVTVAPDGAPHAMPVWAVWHENGLWFSTGGGSRKARNLRDNPRCTVHTEGGEPVVVHGTAEFVSEAVEAVLDAYARKYGSRPPDLAENPLIHVRPAWAFGLVESEFTTSPTRWEF